MVVLSVFLSGCSIGASESGLDVNSSPGSKVFIDGKEVGLTPFLVKHKAGDINLRLVADNKPSWESSVRLIAGSQTVVREEFGASEIESAGAIYYFDKGTKGKSALAVVSSPEAVTVRVDGEPKGFTPLQLDNLTEGDHLLVLSSPGYKDRAVSAKTIAGKKLVLSIKLAQEFLAPTPTPTPTLSGTPTPTPKLSPTPTAKTSPTPKVTASAIGATPAKPYVEITDTPTTFLRVRSDAGTQFTELAQVKPGEKYPYISSKTASDGTIWYQIEYATGKKGFVVSSYAKKVE